MEGFAAGAERAAAGDTAGEMDFARLVEANQAMVFSIALHFFRDQSRAEELAQDVFMQLYRNLDAIESPKHAVNWLRRVASHRCIDESRRKDWRANVSLENLPEPSERPAEPDFLLREKLRRLVAALPEKQRIVIILRFEEDMLPEEISRTLDMPVRTVKSHLQRGLALLRDKTSRFLGEVHEGRSGTVGSSGQSQ